MNFLAFMAKQDQATIIDVVAANVRQLRKAAGLSQEELAHEADLDRTYISQVERQQRNVTITVLARLAAALGVGPERLLAKPPAGRKRD
ncbi:transcriptional regulator with XRE-family HTH domain [Bradyrhizobium liaoningense]